MLKVENLSTSYKLIDGDVHVLNDLNFEIHDNEIFGIAGESGCGKTTLLKTLYDIIEFPLEIDKARYHRRLPDGRQHHLHLRCGRRKGR